MYYKTTKNYLLICTLSVFILVMGCQEQESEQNHLPQNRLTEGFATNPSPSEISQLPEATVPLRKYPALESIAAMEESSSLSPEEINAILKTGESTTEDLVASLSGSSPKGDVMFLFDLTGSMGGELNNAKNNSINIMNAINGVIPDANFGLISHMDYQGFYSGCGYSNTYGGSSDYPYRLDAPITSDVSSVASAINGLSLGNGFDGPENYTRPLYETYSDPDIAWRSGSKKIVVAWLDAVPHDCAYNSILGGNTTTGPDPGRDGIANNEDDLEILETLQEMNDNNIALIVLYSGSSASLGLWEAYAQETGGQAFQINSNGTIPSGEDIDSFIANLIAEEVSQIDELTIETCDPEFAEWLTDVNPVSYTDLVLEEPLERTFGVTLTVPDGTESGDYSFDLCLLGDGAEFGRTKVNITVVNEIEVAFDVHPTSCPNPINTKRKGLMPAAILGTADFDVNLIDPSTISIAGVSPVRWNIEDVSTPYMPFTDKELNKMSCNELGADGYKDLTLKFRLSDIVKAIGSDLPSSGPFTLTVNGELVDGTDIVGEDIVVVVK